MEKLLKAIWRTDDLSSGQAVIAKYLPMIVSVLIGVMLIKYITQLIEKLVKKTKIPKSAHVFVVTIVKIVLWFILIMAVCSRLGVDVTSLVATFSIVGVAISLSI